MAGFRLNPEEDADIIKDLKRFSNQTKRIKEAYRKAMQIEAGCLPLQGSVNPSEGQVGAYAAELTGSTNAPKQQATARTGWSIPKEPTVKQKPPQGSLKANILFKNNF